MSAKPVSKIEFPNQVPQYREEKIFIYFSPRGTPASKGHAAAGDWVVAEPRKPVSPGQTVTWQVVGKSQRLDLDLPAVFDEPVIVDPQTASATVSGDAEPGLYLYEAYVDGQLAIGGSSPGVIIDRLGVTQISRGSYI
jgi:hypothetical protein